MKDLIIGVRELQANLALALRTAQAGGRVLVTRHHRPIAQIGRVEPTPLRESPLDRKLRRLAERGTLRLGKVGPMPRIRADRGSGIGAQLDADRR